MKDQSNQKNQVSRRFFLKSTSALTALTLIPQSIKAFYRDIKDSFFVKKVLLPLAVKINGEDYELMTDSRTTLLDLLREQLQLTGTKKGCDHGQCGACTGIELPYLGRHPPQCRGHYHRRIGQRR